MKRTFYILIIFAFIVNFALAEEDSELKNLSEEDIEIIKNLEILQELEMLKNMELVEDFEAIKDIETIESKGEADEKNIN